MKEKVLPLLLQEKRRGEEDMKISSYALIIVIMIVGRIFFLLSNLFVPEASAGKRGQCKRDTNYIHSFVLRLLNHDNQVYPEEGKEVRDFQLF